MKISIEWIYRTPKRTETVFRSEEMPAAQGLLIAEDLEKTGRAKSIAFIDSFDSTWTIKEMKRYLTEIETEPHNITVYFDGGFDRATSSSGLGCVIYFDQGGKSYRLRQNAPSEVLKSNNEAEYAALHLSLVELELLNVHHLPVVFIGDSQVVINQMSGEWALLEKDLSGWAKRIDEKLKDLGIRPKYELVPRKANAEADRLATQALNGIDITAQVELAVDND
ncbi:reverse transcriptase-like protein [Viridibacillus sp. YIM B01967]|uniref:Reverse transcriptase-like protein n=1 Tax=Viridibacillus soli TaxID=2798301 RepID=A0ABS1H4D9_9BACL|nr:ribonuclease H family protein [Viridibacillus soli]MBK3494166.1 reverse transcriptase-like protein [Viridibacillus soli]